LLNLSIGLIIEVLTISWGGFVTIALEILTLELVRLWKPRDAMLSFIMFLRVNRILVFSDLEDAFCARLDLLRNF